MPREGAWIMGEMTKILLPKGMQTGLMLSIVSNGWGLRDGNSHFRGVEGLILGLNADDEEV